MKEDLRGMFFIVKGRYTKAEPCVENEEGEKIYLGGYDPYSSDTEEWYMCLERYSYSCISCGSNFNKVVEGVFNYVVRFPDKGKMVKALKKQQQVEQSMSFRRLMECVDEEFGDFFEAEVQREEERAYQFIEDNPEQVKQMRRKRNSEEPLEEDFSIKIIKKSPLQKIKKLPLRK